MSGVRGEWGCMMEQKMVLIEFYWVDRFFKPSLTTWKKSMNHHGMHLKYSVLFSKFIRTQFMKTWTWILLMIQKKFEICSAFEKKNKTNKNRIKRKMCQICLKLKNGTEQNFSFPVLVKRAYGIDFSRSFLGFPKQKAE